MKKMKKLSNQVILDLETYNLLRDFKENIERNNTFLIDSLYLGNKEVVYTIDEPVIKLAEANKRLSDEIKKLRHPEKSQPSIDEIKKMSWWQFRKWKNGKL